MYRYYGRPSCVTWIVGFLAAVIAVVFIAHQVYAWLLPLIPILLAVLLTIALVWVGFRRRR